MSLIRVAWAGRTSTYDQQDPTLSLPRQLRASQMVLPDNALIVAHFYDIESGRKDLAARGRGSAHEQFQIPIPRDGGIQDLLAEAERPDRRFDYVICESIDRIARRTYIATDIENRLERAGVRLLAADEPFQLAQNGRKAKIATQLLTRRVKQGISEFYVVEMLEKSWDGFAVHTEEGYNVGKPCYGYRAKRVPHPVPAKRAKGQKKTFLEPDPLQAPVVKKIFTWRLEERLGYQAIADRLNLDPASNPPPTPVDPSRAIGRWTYSNVRDILSNPKHTGHMVWNRHARKTGGNTLNPVSEWIWSPEPVHEALVSLDTYIQVQQVSGHRFGSRSAAGANVNHPQTKRVYRLRTYLFCDLCGRRMFGKTRHQHAYYVCAPKRDYVPKEHPVSIFVREDALVDKLNAFFAHHVFGAYRRHLLDASIRILDAAAHQEREQRVAALRRSIADTEAKIKRTVRNLELVDDPDRDLIRDINERRAELRAQKQQFESQLAEVEERILHAPNPDLIDALPVAKIQIDELSDDLARALFEALRLEIHYNKHTNQATCRITLTGQTITAARHAARTAVAPLRRQQGGDQQEQNNKDQGHVPADDHPGPILVVPPVGQAPAVSAAWDEKTTLA
ncbi:recombinase family protein [Longimycelium tulufanense]|uniref:recombinase family protein n=1 Tax=Longimycelium tulufanense TaxID=907463 RepID=UPI001667415C|nr:recombinase family protein [Longimycelium tulufanense]